MTSASARRSRSCDDHPAQARTAGSVEIAEVTRQSVDRLLAVQSFGNGYLFKSRAHGHSHLSARRYARIVHRWISNIGLDDRGFGTHSLRRTKAAQLYCKTGNLRAVQLLL